jgi:ubiquinone/menaquinone biosynthesis C-methylase UbiE
MSNDVIQNQWDDASETWCDFVRRGKDYYREYMNGPVLVSMMGDVTGKTVLDVGCGEGCFARYFAKRGAVVTGIDVSASLVALAVTEEEANALGITYVHADAADLSMLASNSYDLAFCFMALMDIQDYEGAIAEVSRVLNANGRFVIVITHPCFTVPRMKGSTAPRYPSSWETRVRDDGATEFLHCVVDNYFTRRRFAFTWTSPRLVKNFRSTSFHRTLSDYINTLTKHGLHLTRIEEPRPLAEGVKVYPTLARYSRVPQSLVIEATKCCTSFNIGRRTIGVVDVNEKACRV